MRKRIVAVLCAALLSLGVVGGVGAAGNPYHPAPHHPAPHHPVCDPHHHC